MFMFISEEPTHPVALWESSTASHDLPALELLNGQHSLEISSVCQRLLVELDCSQNSSSSILSKVVIARKSPARTTLFKAVKYHWSNDRKTRQKEHTARMRRRFSALSSATFSSPEAALLLVSTKNHDLWPGPTPEVRDSRTSRHSAHAQS